MATSALDQQDDGQSEESQVGSHLKSMPTGGEGGGPSSKGKLSSVTNKTYDSPGNEASEAPGRDHLKKLEGGGDTSKPDPSWYKPDSEKKPDKPDKDAQSEKSTGTDNSERGHDEKSTGRIRAALTGRSKLVGGGIVGVIVGLVLFLISFFSGPLEFIHFAQLLTRFHFSHNQEFSDGRTMRNILYTINNQGNKTRLGRITNKFANKWEAQLIDQVGLKPLYTSGTNRFAGFEVVDEGLAKEQLAAFKEDGIETNAANTNFVDKDGVKIPPDKRIVSVTDQKFRTRRSIIRGVGSATKTSTVISSIGSRLLIHRGGVDFHPLKNIVRNKLDSLVAYDTKVQNEEAKDIEVGVQDDIPDTTAQTDKKGNVIDSNDQSAANSANDLIKKAEAAGAQGLEGQSTLDALKAGFNKAAGPALILGVLCSVKAFGNNIVDYEYANTVLPEMRLGFRVISTGSQIESGQGVNADELGALSQSFNDPKTKTSWTDARSIQAELGQPQSGPDIPQSAKPSNVSKPQFFTIIDQIPVLGKACSLSGLVSKIPIIGGVVNYASQAVLDSINFAISNTAGSGYTIDKLLNDALSIIAGQGTNAFAKGAEFGNLANYGARLAANDQALAQGGRALTPSESTQLGIATQRESQQEFQQHNIAYRLFSPTDERSAIAKLIDQTSPSPTQNISKLATAFLNAPRNLGLLPGLFTSTAHAATPSNYDYGFPEDGFSLSEQTDPMFDNPFDNADVVENQLGLANLNSKYGNCFSMTVDPNTGSLQNGKAVNNYDVSQKYPQCKDGSEALLRYRFYLADTVNAKGLACHEGDNASCIELGFGSPATSTSTTTPSGGGGGGCNDATVSVSGSNNGGSVSWSSSVGGDNSCGQTISQCNIFDGGGTELQQVGDSGTAEGLPTAASITCQTNGYPVNSLGFGSASL